VIDRTDNQKQGAFIERVHQQKHGHAGDGNRTVGSQQQRQGSQGHHGRVRQHQFHVILAQRQQRTPYRSQPAHENQRSRPGHGPPQNRVQPGQQINSALDHGRRMQIGAHRRWRRHGVRQPKMEGELGGFSKGAAQHRDQNRQVQLVAANQIPQPANFRQFPTPRRLPEHDKTRHHRQSTASGHQQRLSGGSAAGLALVVKANQKVGSDRRQFPKDKESHKVVRQHQSQHRQHEQQQIQAKTAELLMPRQIGAGVQ